MTTTFVRKDTAHQAIAANNRGTYAFVTDVNLKEEVVLFELDWLNQYRNEAFWQSSRNPRPMIRSMSFADFGKRFAPFYGEEYC